MALLPKPKVLCPLGFFVVWRACTHAGRSEKGGKQRLYRRIAPAQYLQNQAIKKTEMGSDFKFRWRNSAGTRSGGDAVWA